MKLYGRGSGSSGSPSDRVHEWSPVASNTGLKDSLQQLGILEGGSSPRSLFPERLGSRDCVYYMRSGKCAYGDKCRFNHPRHRHSVGGPARFGGVPPERPEEPDCQFYLRTGTCKFGASCKFHHPRYTNIRVNSNGYPLRMGEPECSYYLKTGHCKFGLACKFDHPQHNNDVSLMPLASAPPFYPSMQMTQSIISQNQCSPINALSYRGGRPPPPLVPQGLYMPPVTYGPVLVPPGVVPIPSWNNYSGHVSPAMPPHPHPTAPAASPYGVPHQLPFSAPAFAGPYHSVSSSNPGSPNTSQNTNNLPVRPGELDCQFYLKNGNCKFGTNCRFNHPPEMLLKVNCVMSPLGLPLRVGVQPCTFYLQNGSCKFGRMCKFDHPVGTMRYSPSASSLTDVPVAPYMAGSSLSSLAPSFSYIPGSRSESYLNRGTTSTNALIFPQTGTAFLSNVQNASQTALTITRWRSSTN